MEDEVDDETMERVYDSDQDEYFLAPKTKTKTKTESSYKTMKRVYDQSETKPKAVVPRWAYGKTFKNDTALENHFNKHWRENMATTHDYVIKSSFNQKQIYITKLNNELIENIIEPVDHILDEFMPFKSYKNKVTVHCLYKKKSQRETQKLII